MKTILLSGYFGFENFGDDILMKICYDFLDSLDFQKKIYITAHPKGFDYIARFCPNAEPIDFKKVRRGHYLKYDIVMFGGGGRLFNYAQSSSLSGHVKFLVSDFVNYYVPKKLGTRFASVGIGLGPFQNRNIKNDVLRNLRYQDLVYVRDPESQSMGDFSAPDIVKQGHDLFFRYYEEVRKGREGTPDKQSIVFIYRNYNYGDLRNKYIESLIPLSEHFESSGKNVKWISFQKEYDQSVSNELLRRNKSVLNWDPRNMDFSELIDLIGAAHCVFSARMHGILLAGIQGVPVVGVGLHPKLAIAANYFSPRAFCVSDDPTTEELSKAYRQVMGANPAGSSDAAMLAYKDVNQMFDRVASWMAKA